jgi:hypothetical protein
MSWFRQPARHALAAKGVQTRFQRAQLDNVQQGNRVGSVFGKGSNYDHLARSFERRYSEGDEIDQEDYDAAVTPLFIALADADLLVDQGDLKGAAARLELAEREYASLCGHANFMNDTDAKEFTQVARMISEKTVARSRQPPASKQVVTVVKSPQPVVSQSNIDEKSRSDDHVSR